MKKVVVIILILIVVVCCVYFYNKKTEVSNENQVVENMTVKETTEETEDKGGTAGSNIPLKDNYDEAKYQIEVAMQYLFEDVYGSDVFDARIYVDKIYTAEDEAEVDVLKEMNLGPDEVAFEVSFELKPAQGADINKLTIPDGEYDKDSEWITGCHRVGILRPNDEGEQKYKITDYGTGW